MQAWYNGLTQVARWRVLTYVVTTLGFCAGFLLLRGVSWQGGTQLHTLMEVAATLLAFVVGALSLVRFYSVNKPLYLLVGSAFIGTAFLDGYHALVTSTFFHNLFPSPPPSLIPWSWFSSRLFLSLMLAYSYFDWRRCRADAEAAPLRDRQVYFSAAMLTLASFLFFAFIPLPRAYYPELFFNRPEEWLPGVLFLVALIGYLHKGQWREDRFEHWLILSLLVSVLGQVMFMSQSDSLFDAMFDAAHLLKKASYILVMIGLMVSTYFLFRQAEEGAQELAQINNALRDSETRVRAILNTVGEGIIMINERGGIESYNPAAQAIFGYRQEELLGRNINILMPASQRTAHNRYLSRYLETGEPHILGQNREVVGCRKDGTDFPMELSVNELWLGGERKFVGVVSDITQRTQSRHELMEATQSRQAILDSANLSIIATNPQGIILSFNHAAERMLGYSADEVVGKLTPAVIHDPDEVAKRAGELSRELGYTIEPGFEVFVAKARLRLTDENVWTYIRKDGSRFPVLLSVTAIHDEADLITGFLGVGANITERQKIDQMKNEFISVVSHELRTPLTSIRGSLGLLAGGVAGALPDQAKSLIDIACNNSDRLVRLINDILDIEKIEAGKMEFRMETLDLMTIVHQAVQDNNGFADERGVGIEISQATDVQVRADHDRLIQVMTNLLSNAVKFSPRASQVSIAVTAEKPWARISIKDQGAGISDEFKERIFQKFAQADGSDTRSSGGTGLGLNICKALIGRMGGRIDFETSPGAGTTFFCDLQIESRKVKDIAEDITEKGLEPRVLICEDDADVAHLLRMMLEQAGYRADIANDASQAKALLNSRKYIAMTLDIMLPGKDGLALIRELRGDEKSRDLPIVVVSAVASQGKRELNGSAIGIVDWLNKPIDQKRLVAVVDTIAKRRDGLAHILHVEDDADVRIVVAGILQGIAKVQGVTSLAEARSEVMTNEYDLIILDLGLPDGDGVGLLSLLKAQGVTTPVVVFSARDVSKDVAESLAAVMVESATSNDRLTQTIEKILERTVGSRVKVR